MPQSRLGEGTNALNNSNSFNDNSFNTFNNPISFNNTINNTTSFNHVANVNNYGSFDERDRILAWLSPLEPRIRHHDIRAHRIKHVGDWLLQTEEYQNWFHGVRSGELGSSALFCYGDPGVGKTYISSLVIDRLCDWARGRVAAITCFYFDFAAQKEQSPTNILSSILKQVVGGLEGIPAKIVEAFRDQGKVIGGRKLGLDEVVEMLQDISASQPTFICIDALDECLAEYRGKLLDSLKQILHRSPTTRIFLAGRLYIRDEVEKHLAGRVVAMSVTPTNDDIVQFLRAKLGEDTIQDAMDKSLEEDIMKTIPEMVSGMFLLVSLNIKAILQETTLHRRREKLGTMKNGLRLGDAYDATMTRIKAQEGDRARLGVDALMWISHSERPLKMDEICQALAIEIGSIGINTKNMPSIQTVLSCCQGLATVDEGSSTIRLIHFTLKEYLSRHGDLFDRPHSKIAETCLTYLNFQAIKDLSTSCSHDPLGTPFLEYSSLHWGTHMRMELSDRSKDLALDLLDQYDDHISARLLRGSIDILYHASDESFSALHCISYFGVAEVAIDLINLKRLDVNQRDSGGLTPLMWAAMHGREGVVKLLLQQKHTRPDIPDAHGRTVLSWAAGSGHEGVVELFLSRRFVNPGSRGWKWGKTSQVMSLLLGRKYVNPNMPDNYDRTPLSWAADNGHSRVVELLLGWEEVSPDTPDVEGQTPLSWAAKGGHDRVVKLLLGREEVSPDWPDDDGRTPLSWAAWNGRDGVVKLLLGRKEVGPDRPDNGGRTPLSLAARGGQDEVVKLLLAREGVSFDRPDNDGRTPLSRAAGGGHDRVLGILLAREEVSPDRPDNCGRTPLSWATESGHDGIVKLLLAREEVSPDRPDEDGRTPLSWVTGDGRSGVLNALSRWEDVTLDSPDNRGQTPLSGAARDEHDEVVKLLLERGEVSPDRADNRDRTPLSWAAQNGRDGVVKLLLRRKEVTPDRPSNDGRTPLSWAAQGGHDGVVKLLLGRQEVSPDRPSNDGRTPLSWASGSRQWFLSDPKEESIEVVELLLGREDVNPDRPDNDSRTPLSWAAENGYDGIVRLLLGRKEVSPDRPGNGGRTPLSWAAEGQHRFLFSPKAESIEVVELLLGREDVNPDRPDTGGRTPLSWAAENGHNGVVKLLLGQEEISPDRLDNNGRTPLSWAANGGRDRVVKLLLRREEVNPDRLDNNGRTPLSWAAGGRKLFWSFEKERIEVVELLLGREDVSPNRPDNNGRTPLLWADGNGHDGIVRLLKARKVITPTRYKILWT